MYIKREDAINIYCKNCGWREGQCDEDEGFWCEERSLLTKLPSADVVEVVHGEWIYNEMDGTFKVWDCSECGIHMEARWNFCPNCGCRMKGADDE